MKPGWVETQGPQGAYYANPTTGETAWERPMVPAPPPEAEPEGLGADDLLANVPLQPSSSWLLAALWLKSLGWRWPFCWGWFVALGSEEAFKVSTAALLD